MYLCAQVHIAWFHREYIYIYIQDNTKTKKSQSPGTENLRCLGVQKSCK